ncbi:MAG: phosphotransferase [Gammaproteobacteria bacterium]
MHSNVSCVCNHILSMIAAIQIARHRILYTTYLAEHLTFPLPKLTMIGHPTATYPFQFAGYIILKGNLLTKHQSPLINAPKFANTLGYWLTELHALPILNEHRNLIQGEHDWRLDVTHRTQRVLETITQYGEYFIEAGFEPTALIKGMGYFQDLDVTGGKECYVHGDLYAKHILVKNNGLPTGLIDWGDVHIGHPATDISVAIMIFNEDSLKCFFNVYQNIDKNTFDIALFRAFFHPVLSLPYFAKIRETTSLKWTKAALDNAIYFMNRKDR